MFRRQSTAKDRTVQRFVWTVKAQSRSATQITSHPPLRRQTGNGPTTSGQRHRPMPPVTCRLRFSRARTAPSTTPARVEGPRTAPDNRCRRWRMERPSPRAERNTAAAFWLVVTNCSNNWGTTTENEGHDSWKWWIRGKNTPLNRWTCSYVLLMLNWQDFLRTMI